MEWFGLGCALFGVSLATVGKPMQKMNLAYQCTWLATLGMPLAGVTWRPESQLEDVSWAVVPAAAHAVLGTCALLAILLEGDEDDKAKGS